MRKKLNYGYVFVSLWIIGFITFGLYPLIASFIYSFNNVKVSANGVILTAIGLENYLYGFSLDPQFITALKTSMIELLLKVPLIIVLSIFLATLLSQNFKGISFFRVIYFLPVIILSGPIMGYLEKLGYISNEELIEKAWFEIMMQSDFFLFEITSYLIANITSIQYYSAISILIFITIIQRINPELYEAGEMDGANSWEKFFKITLPQLKYGIILNIVYLVVFISTFETNKVIVMIKENMFDVKKGMGYSAMQAWVYMICIFIVMFILLIPFLKVKRRRKYE